jgi:hypothetical protein
LFLAVVKIREHFAEEKGFVDFCGIASLAVIAHGCFDLTYSFDGILTNSCLDVYVKN